MKLHTYLNFGGNCFYEKNLGGKIEMMMRYADQPDPKNVPPGTEKYVLYLNMTIGETQLMGSDVPPERFHPMRSVYLSLGVDSSAEAERIFQTAERGWRGVYADGRDVLCASLWLAAGQVWHVMDDSSPEANACVVLSYQFSVVSCSAAAIGR